MPALMLFVSFLDRSVTGVRCELTQFLSLLEGLRCCVGVLSVWARIPVTKTPGRELTDCVSLVRAPPLPPLAVKNVAEAV